MTSRKYREQELPLAKYNSVIFEDSLAEHLDEDLVKVKHCYTATFYYKTLLSGVLSKANKSAWHIITYAPANITF